MDKIQDLWLWVLSIAATALGYFLRTLQQDHRDTATALNDLKITVARDYITADEAQELAHKINDRFDRLEDKLDNLFTPRDRRRPLDD